MPRMYQKVDSNLRKEERLYVLIYLTGACMTFGADPLLRPTDVRSSPVDGIPYVLDFAKFEIHSQKRIIAQTKRVNCIG